MEGCVGHVLPAAKGGGVRTSCSHRRADEMIRRLVFPARGPGGTSGVFSPDLRQRCRGNTAGLIPPAPRHLPPPTPPHRIRDYIWQWNAAPGRPQSPGKDGKRRNVESVGSTPASGRKRENVACVCFRLCPARRNKDHATERRRRQPQRDNATQRV